MHGHDAHALGALLDDGRLAFLRTLGVGLEPLDEGAERRDALPLGAPREVEQPADVGERLLAGRPDREAGVRAHGGQEAGDGVGDRATVALRCRSRSTASAAATGASSGGGGSGNFRNGCRDRYRVAPGQQRTVVEREERAAQRGEHRQLVVGPLDGSERVAERLDLLALVERAAADQHVGQVARLERAHVRPRDVVAQRSEAAEQQADVRGSPRERCRPGRSRSVTFQPLDRTSQSTNAGHRVGQRLLDLPVDDLAVVAVRLRHRQRDDGRLVRQASR